MWITERRLPRHICACVLAGGLLFAASGCVFTRDAVSPLNAEAPAGGKTHEITTPAKAHLKNGSVVLFPQGFAIGEGVLRGAGEEYDIARTRRVLVYTVPLDQVAAIEVYSREIRPAESLVGVVVGAPFFIGVGVVGTMFIVFAIN